MFTILAAGGSGIILVARPSASSGTITNAANAYDLPSSRPDDPPIPLPLTGLRSLAQRVAGTPDYDVVEYNTFVQAGQRQFPSPTKIVGFSATVR